MYLFYQYVFSVYHFKNSENNKKRINILGLAWWFKKAETLHCLFRGPRFDPWFHETRSHMPAKSPQFTIKEPTCCSEDYHVGCN